MTGKLLIVMLLILSFLYASCASHTAVYPEPVNIQSVIQPGDKVKIVTKDNEETEFVVLEVTDEAILGENIKVSLKDITEIEEETVSAGENALRITILTLLGAAFPEFYTFWSTIPQKQDASKIPTISDGKLVPVEEQKINKTGWRFQYIVIEEGTGKKAVKGKKVKVHYTGKLEDGTEFDSTIKRGEPVEFPLGVWYVIKGLNEGIVDMKVGEKRQLIIPPELGYGQTGADGVPPNAVLIFDVELLDVSEW